MKLYKGTIFLGSTLKPCGSTTFLFHTTAISKLVQISFCSQCFLTWQAGNILHSTSPKNHWPVKPVMGVRGAAVRHIMMSDSDMLHTNKFVPVRSSGVLMKMKFVLLSNIFTIPPENSDDNEDVANSPNDRDKTIEKKEDHLDLWLKDEVLVCVAIIRVAGGQVGHDSENVVFLWFYNFQNVWFSLSVTIFLLFFFFFLDSD